MAAGKVITGFSKPYVALYSNNGTTVSYTKGQILARGVSVDISVSSADENIFYADNVSAEVSPGKFKSGTAKLTVDGLVLAAERLILGLPEAAEANGFTPSGDDQAIPYIGIGVIIRYQSDGVESFTPLILPKTRFAQPGIAAKTQEENTEFQTQDLSATILRDDTAKHNWRYLGTDQTTEAAAESAIKTFLGIADT